MNGRAIDSKIARIEANETVYFYSGDAIGSVHEMIATNGTVQRRSLYTAWGEDFGDSTEISFADRHAFAQRENDGESATMHYRARSMDPRIGRFLEREPEIPVRVEGHYQYASSSPTNLVDPTGRWGFEINENGRILARAIKGDVNTIEILLKLLQKDSKTLPDGLKPQLKEGEMSLTREWDPDTTLDITGISPSLESLSKAAERRKNEAAILALVYLEAAIQIISSKKPIADTNTGYNTEILRRVGTLTGKKFETSGAVVPGAETELLNIRAKGKDTIMLRPNPDPLQLQGTREHEQRHEVSMPQIPEKIAEFKKDLGLTTTGAIQLAVSFNEFEDYNGNSEYYGRLIKRLQGLRTNTIERFRQKR